MIHTVRAQIHHVMWHGSMKSVRFAIGFASLCWALLLFWGSGTINDTHLFDPKRTTYRLMSQVMEEEWWAVAFLIHGVAAWYTLFTARYNRLLYILDPLYGAVIWTFATVACFASHWTHFSTYAAPAAMSAEVSLMLACWWYLVRWSVRK